ncbi:poly-gamma-glutamate hydrolase family protein [Staphylococcus kloosii]|uniref:poly-gamma-glutamate hydrolase family protein n=1 Tax=Staphylococcus kloosii TaxID=29384 RepID=UPI0028A554F0|nr:poly-gamma-glutamate hydrolase family protein [Staphylococcus kloosii]MDT3959660.1 poly-gamma-glutamate hydrolase family protein [Staphylococcus kloosii]
MVDKYQSMTELFQHNQEYEDFNIELIDNSSSNLITAVHGGAIERGTSELAQLIARKGDFSFYTFKGCKRNKNNELHVTSRHFDEPQLLQMVSRKKQVLSIHGCNGTKEIIYIGGRDEELKTKLTQAFTDIDIRVAPAPPHMSGIHKDNFVNQSMTSQGVQLEITVALRKMLFKNNKFNLYDRENENNWSPRMHELANTCAHILGQ